MEQIQAADGLIIQMSEGLWQLSNGRPNERPLLIAAIGSTALAYRLVFAQARQLPVTGGLPIRQIEQVVVGWSRSDKAWHLGFLVDESTAEDRGGRWCELAHWPDEYALLAAEQAEQAGSALAKVIRRPFRFVEAPHMKPATGSLDPARAQAFVAPLAEDTVDTDTLPVAAPAAPDETPPEEPEVPTPEPRGLLNILADSEARTVMRRPEELEAEITGFVAESQPSETKAYTEAYEEDDSAVMRVTSARQEVKIDLPVEMEGWLLRQVGVGLQWARTGVWSLGAVGRVVFNIVMGLIFIVVGLLTLQTEYALVEPNFLPYLGIAIGFLLLYFAARLILFMLRTEAVVVDEEQREVRRQLDLTSDFVATYRFEEIKSVVVSQVAQQRHRGRNGAPDTVSHEAWLHLLLQEPRQEAGRERRVKPEDAYITIGHIEHVEGEVVNAHFEGKRRQRPLRLLTPEESTTPVQQAAYLLAQVIGVDAFIDQR